MKSFYSPQHNFEIELPSLSYAKGLWCFTPLSLIFLLYRLFISIFILFPSENIICHLFSLPFFFSFYLFLPSTHLRLNKGVRDKHYCILKIKMHITSGNLVKYYMLIKARYRQQQKNIYLLHVQVQIWKNKNKLSFESESQKHFIKKNRNIIKKISMHNKTSDFSIKRLICHMSLTWAHTHFCIMFQCQCSKSYWIL